MPRVYLGLALSRPARIVLPLSLAAIVAASAVLAYDAIATRPQTAAVAGEAKMEMLRDEHALIAAYIASDAQARQMANAAVDRDFERMRLMAQGETQRQARISALQDMAALEEEKAEAESKPESVSKPERKSASRTPAERTPPVRVADRTPAGEPLQVVPVSQTVAPANRPVQTLLTDGPVGARLRELASDVRRLPSWLGSAAGRVVEALPTPRLPSLPSLPGRQFRAEI